MKFEVIALNIIRYSFVESRCYNSILWNNVISIHIITADTPQNGVLKVSLEVNCNIKDVEQIVTILIENDENLFSNCKVKWSEKFFWIT